MQALRQQWRSQWRVERELRIALGSPAPLLKTALAYVKVPQGQQFLDTVHGHVLWQSGSEARGLTVSLYYGLY